MNNTQLVTMEKLFHTLGYDYRQMSENEIVDVSSKRAKIKSYNHSSNEIEMRNILKLVRKKDSPTFKVKTKSGDELFKCTSAHRVYLEDEKKYASIGDLKSFYGLNSANQPIECIVEEMNEVYPILDIEVEGNQNYFSNGILSHNTTTGGKALKFYASLRMELSRKETLKKGEDAYGVKTRVKIIKNKVSAPFTECTFDLLFDTGYDFEGSVVEEAVKYDIIKKGGAWFTFKGEKFQGLNQIKEHIKSKGLIEEIRNQVLKAVAEKGFSDTEVNLEEPKEKKPSAELSKIDSPIFGDSELPKLDPSSTIEFNNLTGKVVDNTGSFSSSKPVLDPLAVPSLPDSAVPSS